MKDRLFKVATTAFVWLGLAAMTVIAIIASADLGIRLLGALGNIHERWVILGLAGVAACVAGAVVLIAIAWRLAGRSERALQATVVGGFVLLAAGRLAIAVAHNSHMTGESHSFDTTARGILAGQWDFFGRAPAYPISLAGAYSLLGPGPTAGEMLNLVLGLVAGGALFALVNARAGVRPAVVALYLFALWPAGALISNVRLSETMYLALTLLAALAMLAWSGAASASASGVLLGLAQYVRPTTLALVPALLIARWWPRTSLRRALLLTALPFGVTMLLLLMPMAAYNLQVNGEVSLATTVFGGANLYVGTDVRTGGQWSEQIQAEIDALTPGGLLDDSNAAGRIAGARLLADPLLPLRLLPTKLNTLWGSEDFGVQYAMSRATLARPLGTFPGVLSSLFYTAMVLGATAFAFRRRHDLDSLTVLCMGTTISITLIHVLYEVRDRYHAYATPLFIAVVAMGVAEWAARRYKVPAPMTVPAPG